MTLKERLSETIKTSMKSGDKATLGYARSLHAAIRKKEIDSREDLDDEGVRKIVSSLMKQRQDSIEQFAKGGRDDLVANEKAEFAFLTSYMPAQMGDDELAKLVDEAIREAKATEPKQMGAVMKVLMPKVQGRADGKRINELVRQRLNQA